MTKRIKIDGRKLSSGIVVVRKFEEERLLSDTVRFLMLRVYNYWDFPKGKPEEFEEPIETAKRETAEETGLEDLEFRWGSIYRETKQYGKKKVARYYIASTAEEEVIISEEHHEFAWLSFSEALEVSGERQKDVLYWAQGLIDHNEW